MHLTSQDLTKIEAAIARHLTDLANLRTMLENATSESHAAKVDIESAASSLSGALIDIGSAHESVQRAAMWSEGLEERARLARYQKDVDAALAKVRS